MGLVSPCYPPQYHLQFGVVCGELDQFWSVQGLHILSALIDSSWYLLLSTNWCKIVEECFEILDGNLYLLCYLSHLHHHLHYLPLDHLQNHPHP